MANPCHLALAVPSKSNGILYLNVVGEVTGARGGHLLEALLVYYIVANYKHGTQVMVLHTANS